MNLPEMQVNGDLVTFPGMDVKEAHKFFSDLIVDGKLPVWAPIGMLFKPLTGNTKGDITVRNNTFMEATLSMIANAAGTIFLGLHNRAAVVVSPPEDGLTGELRFDTMPYKELKTLEDQSVRALSTSPYFAFALERVAIHFYCEMLTGYRSMGHNAATLQNSSLDDKVRMLYLPIASNHTLNSYLRVKADCSNGIRVQYLNGFTPEMLQQVWREATTYGA